MENFGNKFCVLRVAKIKNPGQLLASAEHNLREQHPPNADPLRSESNQNLGSTNSSKELLALVDQRVASADKKDSKAIHCMEYVVSASPAMLAAPDFDQKQYFWDTLDWIKSRHGAENVVSACIHYDETTPHLHCHIVPIVQVAEKTRIRNIAVGGGKRENREFVEPAHTLLSANQQFGGPGKLSEMQTDFAEKVGKIHGLERGKKRYKGDEPKIDHVHYNDFKVNSMAVVGEKLQELTNTSSNLAKIEAEILDKSSQKQGLDEKIKADLSSIEAERLKNAETAARLMSYEAIIDNTIQKLRDTEKAQNAAISAEKQALSAEKQAFEGEKKSFATSKESSYKAIKFVKDKIKNQQKKLTEDRNALEDREATL